MRTFLALVVSAGIAVTSVTGTTAVTQAGCTVNVGRCSNGNCKVNYGTCEDGGDCAVTVGRCDNGDSDVVAL